MQKTSLEIFCLSTEKCWGTLQCFRKFRVSKNFMQRKRYYYFPLKFFVTVSKKFVGEPVCVSKKFWYQKISCIGGGHHGFVEIFSLTVPKNFVGEPFCVSENLGFRKTLCIIGGITIFHQKFLVSQYRKTSWRNPFVFQKISGMEKIMDKRWGIKLFRRKFFVSELRKTS